MVRGHDAAEHVPAAATLVLHRILDGRVEAHERVEVGELLANAIAGALDDAQTAPGGGAGLEHLVDGGEGHRVALRHDAASIGYLDIGAALVQLSHDHGDALEHVHRLEAGDDAWDAVFLGQESVGLAADDGADVAGQDERGELQRRVVDDGFQCAGHVLVTAVHGEVLKTSRFRALDGHGHQRGGGLEAHADEYHGSIGVLLGQFQGIEGGIHDLDAGACGLFSQKAGGGAGHAGHVAEGGDDGVGHAGEGYHLVDVVIRGDAYRAARTRCQADALGHEGADAVSGDGHGVGAAHFHERSLGRSQGSDGIDEAAGEDGVLERFELFGEGIHDHQAPRSSPASSGNCLMRSMVSWAYCSSTTSMANPACTST